MENIIRTLVSAAAVWPGSTISFQNFPEHPKKENEQKNENNGSSITKEGKKAPQIIAEHVVVRRRYYPPPIEARTRSKEGN
jgi:hypothetical protein